VSNLNKEKVVAKAEEFIEMLHKFEGDNVILSNFEVTLKDYIPEENSFYFTYKMPKVTLNARGAMQGGLVATLVDRCFAIAAVACNDEGVVVTQDLHMQYLKPVYLADELCIKVTVIHTGSRTLSMNAQVIENGEVCNNAIATFAITKQK